MSTTIDGDTNITRTTDRAATALTVYREGGTWQEAADRAGFAHKSGAYRAAMALLRRHVNETATQLRQEANERHAQKIAMLEDVIYDLEQPLAERLRAVDAHTKAEARHARLNGLDAPVQVALSAGVAADLADALAEAEATLLGDTIRGEVTASADHLGG